MRMQEVDSFRGPLILKLKDKTLDLGNWYIKRNLCTYSLIWTWFLGCKCMQPSSWNASNAKGFESWKLCNSHDILSYFCDFDFWFFLFFFFFLWKTQIYCLFMKDVITHETSSYLFANLFGDSLRVYVLFDLVTWQFLEWRQWSCLKFNQSTEILILGFSPFF